MVDAVVMTVVDQLLRLDFVVAIFNFRYARVYRGKNSGRILVVQRCFSGVHKANIYTEAHQDPKAKQAGAAKRREKTTSQSPDY